MPDAVALLDSLLEPDARVERLYARHGFWHSKVIAGVDGQHRVFHFFRLERAAVRLAWLLRTLEAQDIPAQRLSNCHRSWRSALAAGRHVVVTNYLRGSTLGSEHGAEQLRRLGLTLARLHRITSRRWGRVVRWLPPRGKGYVDYMYSKAAQAAHLLVAAQPRLARPVADALRWLRHELRQLGPRDGFHLLHGDLRSNVVVDGLEVGLIDYDSAQFGHPGFELAGCTLWPFCTTPAQWQALMQGYAQAADPQVLEDFERHAAAFFAVAALRDVRHPMRWLRRASTAQRIAEAERHWNRLRPLLDPLPACAGGWEEMARRLLDARDAATAGRSGSDGMPIDLIRPPPTRSRAAPQRLAPALPPGIRNPAASRPPAETAD